MRCFRVVRGPGAFFALPGERRCVAREANDDIYLRGGGKRSTMLPATAAGNDRDLGIVVLSTKYETSTYDYALLIHSTVKYSDLGSAR